MHPVLARLDREISRALEGLSVDDLHVGPLNDSTAWTIYRIVQHLLLTYGSTTAAMEARLKKGRPAQSAISVRQRIARLFVLQIGWIPGRNEAPPEVRPELFPSVPYPAADQLLMETRSALGTMDSVLAKAEQHFGSVACQSHFALGPMSIAQWRRFHLVHGRHHIRQILRIRRMHLR